MKKSIEDIKGQARGIGKSNNEGSQNVDEEQKWFANLRWAMSLYKNLIDAT
jgi:hypothetical protein